MVVTGPESVVGRLSTFDPPDRRRGHQQSGRSRGHSFFDDVNVHRGYGRICAIKDALTPGPSRWCRDHVLSLVVCDAIIGFPCRVIRGMLRHARRDQDLMRPQSAEPIGPAVMR